jgi:hypothetical protein
MTDGCPSPQQYCQVYIDDIVLVACDIDEAVRQVKHLNQILKREQPSQDGVRHRMATFPGMYHWTHGNFR